MTASIHPTGARLAALAAVVTAGVLGFAGTSCSRPPVEQFRTEAVTRGGIAEVVSATGEIQAIVSVSIGSQVSGTVRRLAVDFNSLVRKGQLLAEIDPQLFHAALSRTEAGLSVARAMVEKAEAALADADRQEARARELFAQGLTSRADVDTASANRQQASASVSVARAQVLQARADRDTAAVNLAYTKITSPIDGIVVSRSVDVGQTVAASFQTPTLFLIANDLTKMQILANIDEADVGKVRPGLATRFTVDAWPGETFEGKIRDVRQAPTTIQNVVTYAAVIDAPNPLRKLRQGMTASVQITTGRREGVLRVPNGALRFRPSAPAAKEGTGGKQPTEGEVRPPRGEKGTSEGRDIDRPGRLYKLVEGRPVAVAVRLGLGDAQRTELLEGTAGLAEGDPLIVGELGGSQQPSGSLLGPPRPPGGGGMRRGF